MAKDKEILLPLGIDDAALGKSVRTMVGDLNKLTQAIDNTNKRMREIGKNAATGSITDLSARLKEATARLNAAVPGTKNYENALKRVDVISKHLSTSQANLSQSLTRTPFSKVATGSDRASYALINLNRVAQDAPYGFLGIANNIDPLVSSFVMLRKETGSVKGAISALATSFMGPVGILTVINLVVSALNFYALAQRGAKDETKDMAKETDNLSDKIRTLAASYEDLAKAQDQSRQALLKGGIAEQEALISALQGKIQKGGIVVRGEFHPFSPEDIDSFNKQIADAQAKIQNYYDELNTGNKYVNVNIKLLQDLVAASKQGSLGIDKFAKSNGLSRDQLKTLNNQLEYYKDNVFAISGGLAKELSPGLKEIALKLGMQKKEVSSAVDQIGDYFDLIDGKTKETKNNIITTSEEIQKQIAKINEALISFNLSEHDRGALKEKRKELQEELNRYGPLKIQIEAIQRGVQNIQPTKEEAQQGGYPIVGKKKVPKNPMEDLKLTREELLATQAAADIASQAFQTLGNAIVDAMFGAKQSVMDVISSVAQLAAKILATAAIKWALGAMFPSLIPFFKEGGVVGSGGTFGFVNPAVFKGAKHYDIGGVASGTILPGGGIPVIAHANEMILTPQHQKNLFNLLSNIGSFAGLGGGGSTVNEFYFENVLEEQKILLKGIKTRQARRR